MKTLYHVLRRRFTTTVLLFASCALLVLLAACGPQAVGSHATTSGTSSVTAPATHASTFGTSSVTASVTTEPMPPTQTSCPANGQGRPAVTAALALGNQQTVVYVDTSSSKSTLKSYTLSTGQTTTLTSVPVSFQVALVDAQVSTDGHYVLFITGRELQMIRMDGQGLQTLYCYPQRTGVPDTLMNLLWSPNQQLAVFEEPSVYGGPAGPTVRLLNLGNGSVQTIAQSGEHVAIQLEAWLGNTQVYYTIFAPPMTQLYNNVYALNVTAPADKNSTEIAPIQGNLWDMNLTPDNRTLILSQCADVLNFDANGQHNQPLPPSLITAQPAHGGTLSPIYVSHVHAVVQTRLSNQAILFVIEDSAYVEGPQDGLWKINLDGTGLTQLVHGHTVLAGTRTTWANVSRDGAFYAAVNDTVQGAGVSTEVYVGPLNGGTPKRFIATNDTIAIAGWTTL